MSDLLPNGRELQGGRYRVDYTLGRGAFGVTYCAAQMPAGTPVAIKEFFPSRQTQRDDTDFSVIAPAQGREAFYRSLKQFLREGRILAVIKHPHVVRVLDCFEELGTAYIVMEMVYGRSLREELDAAGGRGLPGPRVRKLMEQLVDALEAIHVKGLCHLDIRPENVMVRQSDGGALLLDFGSIRWIGLAAGVTQTLTPAYTPPEIIAGGSKDDIGAHSDLYELGMMLHELLTGKLATDRLIKGDNWQPAKLSGIWRKVVVEATRLHWGQRPMKARDWWAMVATDASEPAPIEVKYKDASRPDPARAGSMLQILQKKIAANDFDVFLCHSSADKPEVRDLGERLKERGILPWLDEEQLRPGLPWQRALEKQIKKIRTAAVVVGKNGTGPWQEMELEAFLRKFVNRGAPVIPVILRDCPRKLRLPVFLEGMTWVDFRQSLPDPMERLIWGITGERESNR
jgi:serine/threonine protein kinase